VLLYPSASVAKAFPEFRENSGRDCDAEHHEACQALLHAGLLFLSSPSDEDVWTQPGTFVRTALRGGEIKTDRANPSQNRTPHPSIFDP
jgi:hypothetical protein